MLQIDKLIKVVGHRPDVVFTTMYGEGSEIIYIPENGDFTNFLTSQKLNNKSNIDSITIPNRVTVSGKTFIGNVAFTRMKAAPELKAYEIYKTIPKLKTKNKSRIIDTSFLINDIVTLAHTRSIVLIYNEFFKNIFSCYGDLDRTLAPLKSKTKVVDTETNETPDPKNYRPKILLIDFNTGLNAGIKTGFTTDLDYYFKINKYQIGSGSIFGNTQLPDAIIYKVGNWYFNVGGLVKSLDPTKPEHNYIKINMQQWEQVLKVYNSGDTSLIKQKGITLTSTNNTVSILGFKDKKNPSDILKVGIDLADIQNKYPKQEDHLKMISEIKKFIEGNPILSDLEGSTFQEKLQNLYYGLSHVEKIQKNTSILGDIDTGNTFETEEETKESIKLDQKQESKIHKLSESEKLLVKKYNGTVFIEDMQERGNLGLRSFNPDNIVGLTEFSGYKKQETEFQNNLDDAIHDLIYSVEKDQEMKIKVLNIKSEIRDNNKTRYKRFTAQIQHPNFGQTFKGKYSVILDVPYPTDEKYIKFGGNDYVMVNQLFNKPIQKVNNQLVRLYTHYNTTSVTLKAVKFNGSYGLENMEKEVIVSVKNFSENPKSGVKANILLFTDVARDKYLDFLPRSVRQKFKYQSFKIEASGNTWEFDLSKEKFFEYESSQNEYATINKDAKTITYKVGLDTREFPLEHLDTFLMGIYNRISKNILKRDTIKKSKTSQPYFSTKIIGNQCPVIVLMISCLGFSETMSRIGVKYTFQDKKVITKEKDQDHIGIGGEPINIQFKNGYLTCYPKTFKERALVAGLNKYKVKLIQFIDSQDLYKSVLENEFGSYGYKKFLETIPKIIDNTTEKVLKEYGYPTDVLTLYSDTMPNMMLTREDSHFENLDYYRIRLSETISHIGYNQIQMALSELKRKKDFKDHKLVLKPEFIMGRLLEAGLFQNAKTINPIEEMMLSQKIVKTGIGNVKKEQVTLARRDLNKSYFGVISATATNEYGGIGSNQTLTNGTTIKDRFGTIQTKEYNNEDNPFKMLAPVESLTPFFERDDTTRRIMGNQQTGQFTQLENPDEPLVQTGFESYIPWLVSDRFTKKAKIQGRVKIDTKTNIMTIEGSGSDIGKTQVISLKHAKSRTKRGVYLLNKYTLQVSEGQNVKPGTILASTDSLKTGKLAVGKNVVVAEMPYDGMNYEDGWVITTSIQEKYQNKYLQKLTMLIPGGVKVTKMNITKNQITKPGEVLLEFQKENYHINNLNLDLEDETNEQDDVLYGLEQHRGTSKYFSPGGKILEIQVRLNTSKPDTKIKALWDESIKDIKALQALKDDNLNVDGVASLSIGGHKIGGEEPETGIIEVFIERDNPINNGSKFTLGNSGGKGTVQYIIPKGKEPIAIESQLKVDFVPTSLSIIKRKNPSIIFNMYLGKCFFFINEMIKQMAKNKPDDIKSIENFILSAYGLVDKTKNKIIIKEIEKFFKQDKNQIQKAINQSNSLQKPLFVGLVPPFMNDITMRDIVKLSRFIGIPLKEKVHIAENNTTTLKRVPVGILNVFLLEHFPQTQGSVRGSMYVKSSIVTGQGSSGSKDRKGATKAGLYDLYSILTKTPYNLIKELHSIKSDAKMAKMVFDRQIFDGNGTPSISDIKITKDDTTTKNYIEALFLGAGLKTFY